MSVKVSVNWNGDAVKTATRKAITAGLFEASEMILEESNRIVPHDQGILQNSGETSVDEDNSTASISYDTPYAVAQHEELDFEHQNGRKAKYLETALKDNSDRAKKLIADNIESELKG
jgi:hypothetical protein